MDSKLWMQGRVVPGIGALIALASVFLLVQPAQGQLDIGSTQRAADGTAYLVVRVPLGSLLAGSDEVRVTQIAGSVFAVQSCSTIGGAPGQPTSAATGTDPSAGQSLHPFGDTVRTEIFTPNDTTINFTSSNGGRLIFGSGGGAVEVCRVAGDCTGGATDVSVVALTSSAGGVPAACIAGASVPGVTPGCALGAQRTMLGFGSGLDPDADNVCNTNPTTDTTICEDRPADGFTMGNGQVVVFIYNGSLSTSGFTVGAAGFGVDTDGTNNPACPADPTNGSVVAAVAQNQSAPPPPLPTPTPTPTNTFTPTETFTPTSTFTPTNTFTPTPSPTETRPPIPVVPSPASPAGMLMIGALGLGLLWALRRFRANRV